MEELALHMSDSRTTRSLGLLSDVKDIVAELDDELPQGKPVERRDLSIARAALVTAVNALSRLEAAL
jgi:hypothetical protein